MLPRAQPPKGEIAVRLRQPKKHKKDGPRRTAVTTQLQREDIGTMAEKKSVMDGELLLLELDALELPLASRYKVSNKKEEKESVTRAAAQNHARRNAASATQVQAHQARVPTGAG